MMIPLALIAFWPTPVDQPIQGLLARILRFLHRNGIPDWFSYRFVEASANVALFIPIGFISSLAFLQKPWWRIGAFGLLISGCIELGQLLFLKDRFASPGDLVTNASGAVIGALLVTALLKKLQARRRPAADL
ncbi:VanZ family protein [Arthrobacter sp. AFG7.2]|uniref:VanZ family protein n=1 Tax=Arthrobacter sp. AFG7.2 TaxID=1688693 RepID=UPI000C9E59A7|nr:VanZ family protein [Arthrobacter sp. AFG7.2]PNI07370.1 VanZ family protein [Arthrobacter sp. AFG7.2]